VLWLGWKVGKNRLIGGAKRKRKNKNEKVKDNKFCHGAKSEASVAAVLSARAKFTGT
jgi:hypothetical protein